MVLCFPFFPKRAFLGMVVDQGRQIKGSSTWPVNNFCLRPQKSDRRHQLGYSLAPNVYIDIMRLLILMVYNMAYKSSKTTVLKTTNISNMSAQNKCFSKHIKLTKENNYSSLFWYKNILFEDKFKNKKMYNSRSPLSFAFIRINASL